MPILSQKREAKYQRLLRAALSIFARDGIDGASIADIADAAGVAKGSIYVYFDSKEALAGELVRYLFALQDDGKPVLSADPQPLKRVLDYVDTLQKQVSVLKQDATVVLHMFGHVGKSRNDLLGRGIRQLMGESRFMIQVLLENAQSRGMLPPEVDSASAAAFALASAYGALHQRLANGFPNGHQGVDAREAVRLVLKGLGASE
jgi:AcrR family transcriptional regulator